jgi:glycerate 2-kinase
VLVAPDSFKGTFSAAQVAEAAGAGVTAAAWRADRCPVADGGEGTMAILVDALDGTTSSVAAHDPLGRALEARLGWLDAGATAVVETAQASGLELIGATERDAELASTFGTGELIVAAIAAGAHRVIIAAGGSASTDGGAGALEAIGRAGGVGNVELIVLCDVTTPFEDAAIRFAPQKGADAAAVERLSERLQMQAATLPRDPRGLPMGGAAGGLAGGLWAGYGAQLKPGAPWVLGAVGMPARLERASAVIVGEGRLDAQSFDGKIVGEIVARCRAATTPVHAIVGSCRLAAGEAEEKGIASVQVCPDLPAARAAGARVVALLAS